MDGNLHTVTYSKTVQNALYDYTHRHGKRVWTVVDYKSDPPMMTFQVEDSK